MSNLISPFIVSLFFSLVLGLPASYLAARFGLMDIPGSAPHKQHLRAMPLAGGLLLVVVLSLTAAFFRPAISDDMQAVLIGAGVVFVFGLWDDRKGLSASPKLIGQILASVVVIAGGAHVRFMTALFAGNVLLVEVAEALDVLITFIWLIGIANAMNMIDSMDGIVAGLGVIACAFFMGAANFARQPELTFWFASLLGVCGGLYFWNRVRPIFFLGDSGAQTLGFLLAAWGILYTPLNKSPESSWIVPILLLGVPIFDTSLVVLSRFRRKQKIGNGRRDHTYHRLIRLGLSPRAAVFLVHLAAALIGALAFSAFYLRSNVALSFFFAAVVCGVALLLWLERRPALDE
ncbi:MAG: undecaprenyl/decaprenyl-phosphate alpha-N-acetylglucosaminyl 1-phosphate transferase [Anaerolineales bacterium]|nr:undecaprenyl/decaprenyl-phosphate alpha-N-acetylglucosaminyl 1-phosphate transferase [Anaerolineales bacterium]